MSSQMFVLTKKQLEEVTTMCVTAAGFGLDSVAFKQLYEGSERESRMAFDAIRPKIEEVTIPVTQYQ